jgi:DNA-binding GntR family transcriptional regulator
MARRGSSPTLTEDIQIQIRADILAGRLHPGARLSPAELRQRFGVSLGVIREALTGLTQQRLVHAQSGQGFRVVTLSEKELRDITLVRTDLETRALRLAIERGDLAWEAALVSAHHRLARTPMRTPDDPHRTSEDWAQPHADFHEALIAGCDVPLLLDFCRTLRNATELYRRWSAPAADREHQQRDVAGEHQAILDATLARDLEKATALLAQHYQRTQDLLLRAGSPSRTETTTGR